MTNAEIRAKAREALGGGIFQNAWMYALLVAFIGDAILTVAGTVVVGAIILFGPITYGVHKYFVFLTRGGDEKSIATVFDGFTTDFAGTVLLGILQSVFVFLWSLLFIIPGIVKHYGYAMAYYIKVDHPEYDWRQCLDESQKMMMGKKWRLFCLDFSFIGWIIVGVLCLGVGTLWVIPYMEAARARFYEEIKPAEGA